MKLISYVPAMFLLAGLQAATPETASCPPKEAFQVTYEKQVGLLGYTTLFNAPQQQYAVIDNISIKGTHPANTYLAIELATAAGGTSHVFPPALTLLNGQQRRVAPMPAYARHFLYTRVSSGVTPIGIREATRIIAAPGTAVSIGIQTSTAIEPLSITITGWLVSKCAGLL